MIRWVEAFGNWEEFLTLVMLAYRSSINESTGESPVHMLCGRDIQLPIDVMLGKPPVEVSDPVSGVAYVDHLKDKLCEIHDVAREKLLQASDRQKKAYDLRKNFKNYEVGDSVYLHNPSRKKGTSAKLHSPWNGPFFSPKANVKCVHHDRLKPSHLKLDSWLTSSKDSVPIEDSVPDVDFSLFPDHGVIDQEEEVPASEIVKKSSLNNDESSLDTEVVTTTTYEMGDAVSGQTGIVKE